MVLKKFISRFSQRALAEVTEMIRTSHLVHKGLVNIYPGLYPDSIVLGDMMFGNKIALLGGDYLLGNCCAELAALRNQNVIIFRFSIIYFVFISCLISMLSILKPFPCQEIRVICDEI